MMLKKLNLFAMLMTASVGSLAAEINPATGQWRVTAEYVYLLPTIDDTFFVIDSPVTTIFPNGTRRNNDFDFHSGWRVGGGYTLCDECPRELQVLYTHLNADQDKTIAGAFLSATTGSAAFAGAFVDYTGTAASSLRNRYQRLDILFAQQMHTCCGLDFGVTFGLELAELRLNETFTYVTTAAGVAVLTGVVDQHAKTRGIGPQMGFTFDYELYRGDDCGCPGILSVNVASSGSLLAAKTNNSNTNTLGGVIDLDVSDSQSWRVVPVLHASVGLNYDMAFDCVDASLGIGYEFSSYLRGLSRVNYPEATNSYSSSSYYNYDLQGLYVSGSIKF